MVSTPSTIVYKFSRNFFLSFSDALLDSCRGSFCTYSDVLCAVFILEPQHPGGNKESRRDLRRARGARAYTGSGGGAPSGVQGQSPWWGVRGRSPLKLKAFRLLNFPWNSKICPVFDILLFFAVLITCYLAFTTLLQNCYPSFINSYPGNEELK